MAEIRRKQMVLDGDWNFNIDREEKGEERGWHTPDYTADSWGSYPVPGNWDTYLPELFGYGGVGWYRTTFEVRPASPGDHIYLRFEGANYATTVWLNGHPVGSHEGGFDPFEFDVTGLLRTGQPNLLAVKVDNWPRINRVPNSYAGWWNYGGIFRSVMLLSLPPVRARDIFVHADEVVDGKPLRLALTLLNETDQPVQVTARAFLHLDGSPVNLPGELSAPASIPAGGQVTVEFVTPLPNPALWSPKAPNLYDLRVDLFGGRRLIDRSELRFGVRKFAVEGTKLMLNNQPIFLTGFNRHEEYFGSGRVDSDGQLEVDLLQIQAMNGNLVRMHYQAHPDLYDLADELGLLVFAEIPFWQVGVKDPTEWQNPQVWQTAETMLRTLVGSLKNHPSVVIWSVGNECATQLPESRPLVGRMVEIVKSLDTSRPVAMVGFDTPNDVIFDLVDLPCMNTYSGHNQAGLRERIEKTHAHTPEKPLLVTEFGAEAVLGLHGENMITEEEQASILKDHWDVLMEYPEFLTGALIWCLADYWHMPMGPDNRWSVNRYFFCHGMLSLDREPKAAVEMATSLFGSVKSYYPQT